MKELQLVWQGERETKAKGPGGGGGEFKDREARSGTAEVVV